MPTPKTIFERILAVWISPETNGEGITIDHYEEESITVTNGYCITCAWDEVKTEFIVYYQEHDGPIQSVTYSGTLAELLQSLNRIEIDV